METFRWLSVALSMLLGLGVTRALSSAILVFRSRHRAELDWLPMAWAAAIFVLQLQFWWALIELAGVERVWSLVDFLSLVSIPLLLFAAAALVLPHGELGPGERLADDFERNGRLGLAALSAYALMAWVVDCRLFAFDGLALADAQLLAEAVLPIGCLATRRRGIRAGVTWLYLLVVIWSSWSLSPKAY